MYDSEQPTSKEDLEAFNKLEQMNKEVKPIYIKISPTSPVLPLAIDDELTEEQEQALLTKCPAIHLSATTSYQQISEFLINLFAYYFELPTNKIHAKSDLIDDIERQVWARGLDVPFEEVKYGRIFCSKDDHGNMVGGLEDKGLIIATMFMIDFASLIGIKEVDNPDNATFEARDDELGSYYDCSTISDLADLIYSVCAKL